MQPPLIWASTPSFTFMEAVEAIEVIEAMEAVEAAKAAAVKAIEAIEAAGSPCKQVRPRRRQDWIAITLI